MEKTLHDKNVQELSNTVLERGVPCPYTAAHEYEPEVDFVHDAAVFAVSSPRIAGRHRYTSH